MKTVPYFVIAYGIIVMAGGIMGYLQAKSKPSLIAGGVSGALLIATGALFAGGHVAGLYGALAITLALAVMFSQRYAKGRKFMPAGLMLVLSTLMSIVLITATASYIFFGSDS